MSWSAAKARRVFRALKRIGWNVKRVRGSHKTLELDGWPDFVWAFRDKVEIGPVLLKRIGAQTGLTPEDL